MAPAQKTTYVSVLVGQHPTKLKSGTGWQKVPDYIIRAGVNAVEEGYLKIQPVPDFNVAVAEKFQNDFDIEIDPTSEVIPCNGAGDGLLAILSILLNPGDEVITFDPAYTLSYLIPTFLGATVKTIPLDSKVQWSADANTIESQLEKLLNPRTRVFILVNPDNPTGPHLLSFAFTVTLFLAVMYRLSRSGVVDSEKQMGTG